MKTREIFKKAMEKWGYSHQLFKLFEEMAEMTKALIKDLQKPSEATKGSVIEEIADVEILIAQIKQTLARPERAMINKVKEIKLARLAEMVSRPEQKIEASDEKNRD